MIKKWKIDFHAFNRKWLRVFHAYVFNYAYDFCFQIIDLSETNGKQNFNLLLL